MYLQDLSKKLWKQKGKNIHVGCPHMRYGIYISHGGAETGGAGLPGHQKHLAPGKENIKS